MRGTEPPILCLYGSFQKYGDPVRKVMNGLINMTGNGMIFFQFRVSCTGYCQGIAYCNHSRGKGIDRKGPNN
jgi:hypothetical protein